MRLVYVTGSPGAGKSTVRSALRQRGFAALDVDEDGLRSWYEIATDQLAADQRAWEETTIEWRAEHQLKVERVKVQCLLDLDEALVFLCGSSANDADFADLVDRVIHLSVSDDTLRHRLAMRTNNDYGKHPQELQDILGWKRGLDEYRAEGGRHDHRRES